MTEERDFFELDPNRLDEEWVEHVRLYHEHALKLADARQEYERTKAERELVAAELDREVRSNAVKLGIKVTEAVVANAVTEHENYRQVVGKVIRAKHDVDVAEVAVSTLEHRKKALENLVQLRLSDYYSEPRIKESPGGGLFQPRKRGKSGGRSPRNE